MRVDRQGFSLLLFVIVAVVVDSVVLGVMVAVAVAVAADITVAASFSAVSDVTPRRSRRREIRIGLWPLFAKAVTLVRAHKS